MKTISRPPFHCFRVMPILCLCALAASDARGQSVVAPALLSSNTVIPQWHRILPPMPPPGPRPWPRPPMTLSPVELTSIDADVRINDRHATTTLILTLHNSAPRLQEAEVMQCKYERGGRMAVID